MSIQKYKFFESGKHVLNVTLKKRRNEFLLEVLPGSELSDIVGPINEVIPVGTIILSSEDDLISGLVPIEDEEHVTGWMSDERKAFSKFYHRTLKYDTPDAYAYLLDGFYFPKNDIKTSEGKRFFRGIGHSILCWLLRHIDPTGESIFALSADGAESEVPAEIASQQSNLVSYYERLGFRTCAEKVEDPRFFNAGVCMYGTFNDIIGNCLSPRFTVLQQY